MVRVTPSARRELLELVARVRDRDRQKAIQLVDGIAAEVDRVTGTDGADPELGSAARAAAAGGGHRLYLRQRTDGWWLIAVWPDPEGPDEDSVATVERHAADRE